MPRGRERDPDDPPTAGEILDSLDERLGEIGSEIAEADEPADERIGRLEQEAIRLRVAQKVLRGEVAPARAEPQPRAARPRGLGVERIPIDVQCWAVLALALVVYAVVAMRFTRGTTIFVDEVNYFTVHDGFRPGALLSPLNGHLVLGVRAIYAAVFGLFGADFTLLRLIHVVGAMLVAGLLFVLLKRRIGAPAALGPVVLLLFLGSGWEGNFIVSGLTHVYSLAGGLGAILALERRDGRGDVLGCALLTVSVATWSMGVAIAIGVLVWLLLDRDRRGHLWVALVPLALYAAWLLWVQTGYSPRPGEASAELDLANVLVIPNFVANVAASVAGAVAGLNNFDEGGVFFRAFRTESLYGPILAALAFGWLIWRMRRGPIPPLLWGTVAILLAFWVALGLSDAPGRTPETIRNVYPSAAIAFLVGAEAVRGARPSPRAVLVVLGICALALLGNLERLRDAERVYRPAAISERARLSAVELARDRVPPSLNLPSAITGFGGGTPARYLAAVDRVGSPAFSADELARQPESAREAADEMLVSALHVGLRPRRPGESQGPCRTAGGPAAPRLPVRPPGVLLRSRRPARVLVRRFAAKPTRVGMLRPGRPAVLSIPRDRSPRPWSVTLRPPGSRWTACALSSAP
jgi:hypothetical protein